MSFLAKSLEGGFADEEVEVHRRADRLCFVPGRDGQVGSPGLPEVGDLRAAVFRDTSLFYILTPNNRKLSGLISLAEPEYHYFAGRWD